ncbi:hypothetical protein [Streptomyces sp. NPDC004830]
MSHQDASEQHGLGTLEPGTRQRAQLPTRIADIAWSALAVLVALWAVWASVGAVRGTTAWGYCAAAWVLLAVALTMRVLAVRRRAGV